MLWLALATLIATDPAAPAPPQAPASMGPMTTFSSAETMTPRPRMIRLPALPSPQRCETNRIERVAGTYRRDLSNPTDGRVRMYHLFSLQVGGCAIPVVARDSIPEADRSVEMNAFSGH